MNSLVIIGIGSIETAANVETRFHIITDPPRSTIGERIVYEHLQNREEIVLELKLAVDSPELTRYLDKDLIGIHGSAALEYSAVLTLDRPRNRLQMIFYRFFHFSPRCINRDIISQILPVSPVSILSVELQFNTVRITILTVM